MTAKTIPVKTPSRQRKTPAQRAQENYDLAVRVAARAEAKLAQANAEIAALEQEARDAVARRDYLAGHPDLPKPKDAS